MIYVDRTKPVDIPARVVECPECYATLWIEINEWEPDSGEITEAGFEIHCALESIDQDLHDERWREDWQPVETKIFNYLSENVRIAQVTQTKLNEWRQAVQDWQRTKTEVQP